MATQMITPIVVPSLESFFRQHMEECWFVDELSSRLEAVNLDHWVNLDSKIRSLAQRQFNTPEKMVEKLFGAENADEFINLLLA